MNEIYFTGENSVEEFKKYISDFIPSPESINVYLETRCSTCHKSFISELSKIELVMYKALLSEPTAKGKGINLTCQPCLHRRYNELHQENIREQI